VVTVIMKKDKNLLLPADCIPCCEPGHEVCCIIKSAKISGCGGYRYNLVRNFVPYPMEIAVWIMLNPSTADADLDDPTVRRCISFSKENRCDGLTIINLFAGRATRPKNLFEMDDPVGPENDEEIKKVLAMDNVRLVVAAWGTKGVRQGRDREVVEKLLIPWGPMTCLGVNRDGSPKHPLYIPSDKELEYYSQYGGDSHAPTS